MPRTVPVPAGHRQVNGVDSAERDVIPSGQEPEAQVTHGEQVTQQRVAGFLVRGREEAAFMVGIYKIRDGRNACFVTAAAFRPARTPLP
ncbi:MAG TPA: hypothetical protein VKV80_12250 [Streptosporangiaceae bacterium]|nr:hypothetical protein [Streptosporangiaceae bacterium]